VGKHKQQKCEGCHTPAKIAAAGRVEIKVKDLNHTFLGLRRECLSCHKDQHQSSLGTDCLKCHSQDGWKPANGFNHSTTHFPLTGQHQTVACQKCHGPKPEQEVAKYKPLEHDGCQDCHKDPHKGAFAEAKFRGNCNTCHNTNGWKKNSPGTEFSHATTKFPLQEKHATVKCNDCHKTPDFKKPIAHEKCKDCHEDPHKGQFAKRAAGSDCGSCHNEKGFKPTIFDLESHRKSAFPLEGKHTPLKCAECHQPEGKNAVYMTGKLKCETCHKDRHEGEFAAAPRSNQCDQCHKVDGFKPTTFNVEKHEKTRFALAGKHAKVDCEKCHKPLPVAGSWPMLPVGLAAAPARTPAVPEAGLVRDGKPPIIPRQYHFSTTACLGCHNDPHETKLECETCHTSEDWKALKEFDHPKDKFKLEYGHEKAKCVDCHKPAGHEGNEAAKAPKFPGAPLTCIGCHLPKDPHDGQFQKNGRELDCSKCHVTARWKGEDFDHETTRFGLTRVHRIECAKCHKEQHEVNGKLVRTYRGTPSECVQCH